MTNEPPKPGLGTLLIHADAGVSDARSVVPPIYQTANFRAGSADEFLAMATEPRHHGFYTRYGNRTHAHAEAVIAALEGAEAAMLAASGMGAISTAVLTFVGAGDHVVMQESHYAGITSLGRDLLPRFGAEVTTVDQTDPAAFERALRPNTRLVVVESPSNPLLRLTDLRAVAEIARDRGALTLADNTFATPVNQRPLELGIDLVAHSATKYLGGHSDLTAGVVAGAAALVEKVWKTSIVLGATAAPLDSWLLLRGLRTLQARMERHNRTGLAVARFLEAHPKVLRVNHPGVESHPQRDLARRQMRGASGILSVQLRGGYEAAERFVSSLRLFARAASVGGVESHAVHPAAMLAGTMTAEQFAAVGVEPDLVRLSVGLEEEADLLRDLEEALQRA